MFKGRRLNNTVRYLLITFLSLALPACLLWMAGRQAQAAPPGEVKEIYLGVLANRGVDQAYEDWNPTAEYLTSQLPGYRFTLIPLSLTEMGIKVEQGKIDFLLTNSSSYVEMEMLYGASRILTLEKTHSGVNFTTFGGVIFCRSDRKDIKEFADLAGKSFMGADPGSFGGFQAAWRELLKHGINPYKDFSRLEFSNFPQDSVVYAVRDGKVDAGTVRTEILELMAGEGKIDLKYFRILNPLQTPGFPLAHSTGLYPEWPLAKVRQTPEELARKVAVALLNMPTNSPAARAANIAGWTIPLDYQPVHQCLRELRINPYKDYGKVTLGQALRQHWPIAVTLTAMLVLMAGAIAYVQKTNRTLRQARLEAEYLACTDYLTGLLNRRAFMERLEAEISRTGREGTPVSIILTDIDHFKKVNDSFGHQSGDLVLQVFASCLSRLCRPYDFIGRYGGEEFIICLPCTSGLQAEKIAERMRSAVEEIKIILPENEQTQLIRITSSFGLASLEANHPAKVDDLIQRADGALYRAKAEGRNRTCSAG